MNFVPLPQDVIDKCVSMMSPALRFHLADHYVFLAGGFIRSVVTGEPIEDADLFGISDLAETRSKAFGVPTRVKTKNAITIKAKHVAPYKIQYITRWSFSDPLSVIKDFDFTISQAVIWYDIASSAFKGLMAESFLDDCAAKRLCYSSPNREEEPAGSLVRVLRFVKRGYSIAPGEFAKVLARAENRPKVKSVSENSDEFFVDPEDPVEEWRDKILKAGMTYA